MPYPCFIEEYEMILVIGPRFSFKKEFIMRELSMSEEDWEREGVSEAQELVRRFSCSAYAQDEIQEEKALQGASDNKAVQIMDDKELSELASRLLEKRVVTISETGSGVVPVDAYERLFREQAGKLSLMLAEGAEKVYRVVCGLPQILKG